jgi:sRNA-binding carbon storage regulator CsrA
MLALKRFLGEKVIILCKGVQVEIMLVDVRGSAAILGFEAPEEATIIRKELLDSPRQVQDGARDLFKNTADNERVS